MSELRRKMLTDLQIRNYAKRTQEAYIARVSEMARDLGRSPAELSGEVRFSDLITRMSAWRSCP